MWPMEGGENAVQLHPNTAPASLAGLAAIADEEGLDIRPRDV